MPGLLSGLERLPQPLAAFWKGLSGAQRFAFVSILLITFGGVALLVNVAGEHQYAVLYSDLSPEDSAKIVDELSTGQVPFKLTHAGTTVQVPLERVYDVRLEIAAKGIPGIELIGPAPAFIHRLRGRYRWQLILRGRELSAFLSPLPLPPGWAVNIDLVGLV